MHAIVQHLYGFGSVCRCTVAMWLCLRLCFSMFHLNFLCMFDLNTVEHVVSIMFSLFALNFLHFSSCTATLYFAGLNSVDFKTILRFLVEFRTF